MKFMEEDKGITLAFTRDDAQQYIELAKVSDKSLEDAQDIFRDMLKEAVEHPFRDTLPENLEGLLSHLETLPYVDCELLPNNSKGVIKGWLLHSAVLLALVSSYYEVMSAEA